MRAHLFALALIGALTASAAAQTPAGEPVSAAKSAAPPSSAPPASAPPVGIVPPADYVIGISDALDVVFWREKDMSASVFVRPDGMISLPLLNEVQAAGLTPEQLRATIAERAGKFVEDSTVTIVVKEINSRRVYITGQVAKPGAYTLLDKTTVLQLISMAGGVAEYADDENIRIVRTEKGRTVAHRFNYDDVKEGKSLTQNIVLEPGDTVIVP